MAARRSERSAACCAACSPSGARPWLTRAARRARAAPLAAPPLQKRAAGVPARPAPPHPTHAPPHDPRRPARWALAAPWLAARLARRARQHGPRRAAASPPPAPPAAARRRASWRARLPGTAGQLVCTAALRRSCCRQRRRQARCLLAMPAQWSSGRGWRRRWSSCAWPRRRAWWLCGQRSVARLPRWPPPCTRGPQVVGRGEEVAFSAGRMINSVVLVVSLC